MSSDNFIVLLLNGNGTRGKIVMRFMSGSYSRQNYDNAAHPLFEGTVEECEAEAERLLDNEQFEYGWLSE